MRLAVPLQRLGKAFERLSGSSETNYQTVDTAEDQTMDFPGEMSEQQESCASQNATRASQRRRRRLREQRLGNDGGNTTDNADDLPRRIPSLSEPSHTVPSADLIAAVVDSVPKRFRGNNLQLVYSTFRDGASLKTFYTACARCGRHEPLLLIVRDIEGGVFGAYTPNAAWRAAKEYYGSGEAFVFTMSPSLNIFKWSRRNSFFQLGSAESIAIGGGGSFALFLDEMCKFYSVEQIICLSITDIRSHECCSLC